MIHRKKNDLLHKDATYIYVCVTYSLWNGKFTRNRKQIVHQLKIFQSLSTLELQCVVGGVKCPQWEGTVLIHHKKDDLVFKDATICLSHILWQGQFATESAFFGKICARALHQGSLL